MKHLLVLITLAALSAFTASANAGSIDSQRQNELLYFVKHDCGSCHGLRLKGGLGPALLPETLAAKPDTYLVTTILEGRDDTAMPPWKPMLSHDEAAWIVKQLKNGGVLASEVAKNNPSKGKQ